MKKNQLIKALVFTAVLAAFPAAGLTASAEDAAPADFAAINDAAPVAAQAEDVVIEAAPAPAVVEEAPVVVEAAPVVDDTAVATAEGTDGKDTKKEESVNPAPAPAPTKTYTTGKITLDDEIIKAGETAKITPDLKAGNYADGVDDKGNTKYTDYKLGYRYFSSDNSIATVDADGTVHAKKAGKVTIYVETLEGTKEITLNVTESYNVLLIDRTTSTTGKGLAKEKSAAISFSEEVLKVNSESHIAVVQIGDTASTKTLSTFTNNLSDIKNTINSITASKSEYSVYSAGLKEAGALLNGIPNYNKGLNKNVVIFGDGACTYGDRDYAKSIAQDMINADDNLTIYTFGVYDSATDAEKKEGEAFLKSIGQVTQVDANGNAIKINNKEVVEDNYYEVGNVADLKDTFKAIAKRPTYSGAGQHYAWTAFDVVVYGKDAKKADKKEAAGKKNASEASSPETADSSSIYVIALFALLGAGVAGVSAKKRFED
jgi:hypothetical protein